MIDTRIAATPVQKVVVVNGNTEVLGMLETVLDAGRYDMVFVESGEHAYSQVKKVLPNLVILCTRIERLCHKRLAAQEQQVSRLGVLHVGEAGIHQADSLA